MEPLDRDVIRGLLERFELRDLFVEQLGWDHGGDDIAVEVEGSKFSLEAIAQKRGLIAYRCVATGDVPDHRIRQKIERAVTRIVREHMIIYAPGGHDTLYWQWVKREPGQPDRPRQHIYTRGQPAELLAQKLEQLRFALAEEDDLTIVDATARVRAAFDIEKVTRRFYDCFKDEHRTFLGFIKGIREVADREWYASLMLNRMMFIYFIQKRGFLDGDTDYLRNRLASVQAMSGKGKFHSFYRLFLRRLFREGLGQPEDARDADLMRLLGRVPYLNGGLFDVHDLERDNPGIDIPDSAFGRIFDFFDTYQWHLDDRPLRRDNEINPDVLGYIFEKYVNQKQMGAYYTKEDITGYISRNTIIPLLFDRARKDCAIAFRPNEGVWLLLADNPDDYFHDSVRHGISHDVHTGKSLTEARPLPPEIAAGVKDVDKRADWNKAAPREYGLPTETWRECIARRHRYEEIRARLAAGEVSSINDLVTCNLNIEKFAQDAILSSDGPELVRAFWKAIREVSILDPTVGSGAFLFAALNILEPLYNACLDAMRGFLDDLRRSKRKHRPEKLKDFRSALDQIEAHPGERYFVLKSIVIDNLYGVDIMEEAVEICKLRLFLKLVGQLKRYEQIEPLPDIDFNIRAGNTLVGFTSLDEVRQALGGDLVKELSLPQIEERAQIADRAFRRFRAMQTEQGMDAGEFTTAKAELRSRLDTLRDELDAHLAGDYGVNVSKVGQCRRWLATHQPFHWFVEFYGVMHAGGFDVVLGNPPYIAAGKVKKSYTVRESACSKCPDVYAWVLERSAGLLRAGGRTGMIVPLSLGFSSAFDPCRRMLHQAYGHNWFSSFGRIPSALFSFDVRVRNTIHIGWKPAGPTLLQAAAYTTRLHRWFDEARPPLFDLLEYAAYNPDLWNYRVPKLNSSSLVNAFETLIRKQGGTLGDVVSTQPTKHVLHFKKTAYNWLNFCRLLPPCYDSAGRSIPHTQFGQLYFGDSSSLRLTMLLGVGKLMFVYWCTIGDDFHVMRRNATTFPIKTANLPPEQVKMLLRIFPTLEEAMKKAVQFKVNAGRKVGNYNLARCRDLTDVSDRIFCNALGIGDAWESIDLCYNQVIRTDFQKLGEVE